MRLIDADALLRALGVGEDCDNCQYKQWMFCKQSSEFVNACEAIADAPTIEPEQRWIPCSERLPEEYGMYLVTKATRKTELEKGYRNHVSLCVEPYTKYSHWGKSTCGNVAWMPLPEPYREEGEQE